MAFRKFSIDDQKIPFTDFQIEHLYHGEGMSLRQIAKRFGVSHQAVHERFNKAGIPLRPPGGEFEPIPVDEETLRRLYEAEKLSIREVAERLSITQAKVRRRLKKYDIERRPKGTHPRKYKLGGLPFGESVTFPRPARLQYHHYFHRMAKLAGIRVTVRTIDEKTVRVTRIG